MAVLPPTSSCLELTISIPGVSGDQSVEGRSTRNLDINQVPVEEGEDQNLLTMSINFNSNNSSVEFGEQDDDRISSGDGDGGGGSSPPRKKLRLSKEQSRLLEESFLTNHTLNPKRKDALSTQLKLKPRQVEVWFQNRRARSKLKQTEMECEYLKRWFGSLTEQNHRLQRELSELRALKAGPPSVFSAHSRGPPPASALTMCPRCEHVTASNPPATSSAGAGSNMIPATKQPAAC